MSNIKVGVEVSSGGSIPKTTKEAEDLGTALKNAADSAQRIPRVLAAAKQAQAQSKTSNKGSSGMGEEIDSRALGLARSVSTGTGAAGRDFAKQSEGLGGLVRLYAIYAANLYAAGAAFNAMSKAMDTTNMVKGLDQLGIASGKNLGTLSKSLALASDGAINLRDSMEAVAKASSAGLSSKQIMQLGDVAKTASQALGISMPDALNRLSRGVSKLEPELLDELGIFVRIDDATRKYAASLNRSVSSLTDFERRQAFANAVIEQGINKFSEIDIDVNPYNKLLASFQNLAQAGLELANKVLTPIVNILAESPVALAAAIGLIATTLLRSAIPALGAWREGLRDSAEQTALQAKRISDSFGDSFNDKLQSIFNIPKLKRSIEQLNTELAKIGPGASAPDMSDQVRQRLAKDAKSSLKDDFSEKQINNLNNLIATRQRYIDTGKKGEADLSETQRKYAKEEIDALTKRRDYIIAINQQNALGLKLQEQKNRLQTAFDAAQEMADKPLGRFDPERLAIEKTESLMKKYNRTVITSTAAETASIIGVKAAWKELNNTIEQQGIQGVEKWKIQAQGGIAAIGSRIAGLASKIGTVGMVIGTFTAAFSALNSVLTNTAKESAKTEQSLDELNNQLEFISKIDKKANTKGLFEDLSPKAITAKSIAVRDLADNIIKSFEDVKNQLEKMNWWDTFINALKAPFGGDLISKASRSFSEGIAKVYSNIPDFAERLKEVADFKVKYGVDPTDVIALQSLVDSQEKYSANGPKIQDEADRIAQKFRKLGDVLNSVDAAFTNAQKAGQDFITSILPSDPLAKFGLTLFNLGTTLETAFLDATTAVSTLIDILKSPSKLELLPGLKDVTEKQINTFLTATAAVKNYNNELSKIDTKLSSLNKDLENLSKTPAASITPESVSRQYGGARITVPDLSTGPDTTVRNSIRDDLDNQLTKLKEERRLFQMSRDKEAAKQEELFSKFVKSYEEVQKRGTDLIRTSIFTAFKQASIEITKNYLELLGDSKEVIRLKADAELRSLDLQINQLNAQKKVVSDQIKAQSQGNAALVNLTSSVDMLILTLEEQYDKPKGPEDKEFDIRRTERQKRREKLTADTVAREQAAPVEAQAQKTMIDLAQQQLSNQILLKQQEKGLILTRLRIAEANRATKTEQENLKLQDSANATAAQRIRRLQEVFPYLTRENFLLQQNLEDAKLSIKQEEERGKFASRYAAVSETIAQNTARALKGDENAIRTIRGAVAERIQIEQDLDLLGKAQEEERKRRNESRAADEANNDEKRTTYEQNYTDKVLENAKLISEAKTQQQITEEDSYIRRLQYEESLGLIKAQTLVSEQARIDLLRQETEYNRQLADLEESKRKKLEQPTRKIDELKSAQTGLTREEAEGPIGAQIQQQLTIEEALVAKINAAYTAQKSAIDAANASKKDAIKLTIQQQMAAAKLKDSFMAIADALKPLGKGAALLGTVIEDVGKSLSKYSEARLANETRYATESKSIEQKRLADIDNLNYSYIDDMDVYNNAKEAINKEAADRQIALDKTTAQNSVMLELDKNAMIAGSTKKLFKEKTAAFRILDSIEKGLHFAKLAMMIKEMFFDKAQTAAAVTNSGARAGAAAGEMIANAGTSITNQGKGDPYSAFARIAAMTGIMVAILSAFGGKSKSVGVKGGFSAKDRQETQGTGMKWQDGQKVETGRGVFGDAEAKLDTMNNSLKILKDNTIEGLNYDNQVVRLLGSINTNIGVAARQLYGVQGLRSGTLFGTQEGSSGGGFLGLGTKRSTEIKDTGIILEGTIGDIIDGINITGIQFYETVQTTTKRLFRSAKTSIQEFKKSATELGEQKFVESVKEIFAEGGKLFVTLADKLGMNGQEVLKRFRAINLTEEDIRASLRGLKGEEAEKEVTALISGVFDLAADSIFEMFNDYKRFGEDMLTTIIRITDTNEKVRLGLKSIGMRDIDMLIRENLLSQISSTATVLGDGFVNAFAPTAQELINTAGTVVNQFTGNVKVFLDEETNKIIYTTQNWLGEIQTTTLDVSNALDSEYIRQQSIAITDSLTKLFATLSGEPIEKGLEIFTDRIKFFRENFLTEAERLVPIQETVNTTLSKLAGQFPELGLGATLTREQFKQLVLGINLATDKGKQLYAELQLLAPAFDTLADANEKYAERIRGLESQLLETSGLGYEVLLRKRQDAINKLETQQERDLQSLIYAQEDRNKIIKLETELLQVSGFTYEALLITREQELLSLSEQEKTIKRLIYAEQDRAKTDALRVELLELEGNTAEATRIKRLQELKGMSSSDRELKIRIWRLQDERKALEAVGSMEEKIYTLLGKKSEALAITRRRELEALDEALRPGQLYIYALEDEAILRQELTDAYDKQKTSITSTIQGLRDSIKALRDYKNNLLLSDELSILTPEQKYNQAKQEALRLAAVAASTATTEAERLAQQDALDKLPAATDSWLQASRTLYASSQAYTNDFNQVTGILDTLDISLGNQLTEAEKQLKALESSEAYLNNIKDNTRDTADILRDLKTAMERTEAARVIAADAGFAAAGGSGNVENLVNPIQAADLATLENDPLVIKAKETVGEIQTTNTRLQSIIDNTFSTNTLLGIIINNQVNPPTTATQAQADATADAISPSTATTTTDTTSTISGGSITVTNPIINMGGLGGISAMDLYNNIYPPTKGVGETVKYDTFAKGGLASGMSLVGEQGPELVDFNNPGRVYPANSTATMIGNTQVLIDEIKQLREEVARLRQEQQEQTGHLITTNYDANNRAAETISESQIEVLNSTAWKDKLMPKVI